MDSGWLTTTFMTVAIDVALFAWMHFTPEGLAFGAGVADFLGFTSGVAADAGMSAVTTAAGAETYVFN
jgi:hypothetical protein